MTINKIYHTPALLKETIGFLKVKKGGKYIDATLGGGGHSEEIIKRGGIVLGLDMDKEAIKYAKNRLSQVVTACPDLTPPKIVKTNFSRIKEVAEKEGFSQVDGILFDLGVSTHQLETPSRGFSFNLPTDKKVELDMRMDPENQKITAKDLINILSEKELSKMFKEFGEEKFARKYARAICRARLKKPIVFTDQLVEIIMKEAPKKGPFERTHPATRVFQALRIAVNSELESLKEALPQTVDLLAPGGRLAILSFHSLEDGIVKRFFTENENQGIFKIITPKPVTPTAEEIAKNPRTRSAKLRVAARL